MDHNELVNLSLTKTINISKDIIDTFEKEIDALKEYKKKEFLQIVWKSHFHKIFRTLVLKSIAITDFNYVLDILEKDKLNSKLNHWIKDRLKIGYPRYYNTILKDCTGDQKIEFITKFKKSMKHKIYEIMIDSDDIVNTDKVVYLLNKLKFDNTITLQSNVLLSYLEGSVIETYLYDVELGGLQNFFDIAAILIPKMSLQKRIIYFENIPEDTMVKWKVEHYSIYNELLGLIVEPTRLQKQDWEVDDDTTENDRFYGDTPDKIIRNFMNRNIERLFWRDSLSKLSVFDNESFCTKFIDGLYENYPGAFTHAMLRGVSNAKHMKQTREQILSKILLEQK